MASDTLQPKVSPVPEGAEAGILAPYNGTVPERPAWAERVLADAPRRSFIIVAGAAIEVLEWGQRGDKGLLLAHGNGAHADWWSFIAPLLASEGRHVVALTWSGMGGSDWRKHYTMDGFLQELMAVAEATEMFADGKKPVFAGHSFGGFPVLRAGGTYADRLKGIITLDSLIEPPSQMWDGPPQRSRPNRVYHTIEEALARFRLAPPQPCETHWALDWIARNSLKRAPFDDGTGQGWTWKFDPFIWNEFRMGDPTPTARAVACPIAIIRGEQSKLADTNSWTYMKSLFTAGTPFLSVPEARHHLMLDQPIATIAAMRAVLGMWGH
jgi:pimeloyl-ACP methyl ester carboxylesterase